jgi:hypothetical protein
VDEHRAASQVTAFLDGQRPAVAGLDNPFHVCLPSRAPAPARALPERYAPSRREAFERTPAATRDRPADVIFGRGRVPPISSLPRACARVAP